MSTRRALDLSTGIGAAYATKLLADVGWDVVKVEPQGGDPLRRRPSRWGEGEGGAFAFVNRGKRSISASSSEVHQLAASADVVVGDFSPSGCADSGLPRTLYDELMPRAAVVSVTPFGLAGPRSSWGSSDLVVQAMSGLLFLTGEWDQDPMQLPPDAAALTGGIAAGIATLGAVRVARRGGGLVRLDIAIVEAVATHTYAQTTPFVTSGEVARREQRIKQGLRMVPAQDRFLYCAPGAIASMDMTGVAELINEPRLKEDRFQTAEGRMQNYDEYLSLFIPPFRAKTAQEWCDEAERLHLTFALVQTVDDLFTCPQVKARGLMQEIRRPDGAAVAIPGRPFRLEGGPAPSPYPWPIIPGQDRRDVFREWLTSPKEV